MTSQIGTHTQTDVERGSPIVTPPHLCIWAKAAIRHKCSLPVGDGMVDILRVKKDPDALLDIVRIRVVKVIGRIVTPVQDGAGVDFVHGMECKKHESLRYPQTSLAMGKGL